MVMTSESQSGSKVEISVQNFQSEVVDRSQQQPVVLEFYAAGAAPSEALSQILEGLIARYQGKLVWARVDVQANPQLVQQLGVRGLPTIKVVKEGQLVESLEGPQEEERLKSLFDQLTVSPAEQVRAQIAHYLSLGDRSSALAMLKQMMTEEPSNLSLHTEYCDLLVQEGAIEEAERLLSELPADAEGIGKAKSRLFFVKQVQALGDVASLKLLAETHAEDQQHLYHYACALVVEDQITEALDVLLNMLRLDKTWEADTARNTMIQVFDLLGKGDPLASAYRRKMFTLMH